MSIITLRAVKGSELTHPEADANFNNLNNDKLEIAAYSSNSSVVIRDSGGNIIAVQVPEGFIIGRKTGGQIGPLTAAEVAAIIGDLTPEHEWSGTQLRFRLPDGSWGAYVDLEGAAGADADQELEELAYLYNGLQLTGNFNPL